MKATTSLHDLGQSLWLDNITRELLQSGTLKRYIDELSVTGLTSNPTIFDNAIKSSSSYDADIATKVKEGKAGEELFFELALDDLTAAADLFRPIVGSDERRRRLGFARSVAAACLRHRQHHCRGEDAPRTRRATQSLHQDPRHKEGLPAIEESDLCRHSDQRHAAVFAHAVPGGSRSVPARDRASDRRGAEARGRVGGVGLHQPVGRIGRQAARRQAAQSARHRRRHADLQGVPRAPRLAPLAAHRQRRRPAAALAVGEHGHEGSDRVADVSTSTRLRRRSRSTPCPRAPSRRSPTMARRARICVPTAATATRSWRGSRKPASTSHALAERSSRKKAPSRSSASWHDLMDVIASKSGPRQGELTLSHGWQDRVDGMEDDR